MRIRMRFPEKMRIALKQGVSTISETLKNSPRAAK